MPIPFLVAAGAWLSALSAAEIAAAAAVVGVAALAAANEIFSQEEEKELINKKIVILGERGVGKSHLYSFLKEGKVPTSHEQTPISGVKKLGLRVEKFRLDGTDVAGGDSSGNYHSPWQAAMEGADFVLHLVDASKLLNKESTRFELDSSLIVRFLKENKEKERENFPCLFIVGSHMDKIASAEKYITYEEAFSKIEAIQKFTKELGGLGVKNRICLGSLNENMAAAKFVKDIFGACE